MAATGTYLRLDELPDLLRSYGVLPEHQPRVSEKAARSLLAAFDRHDDPRSPYVDATGHSRAAGADTHPGGEEWHHYWTKDPEGLGKWATLKEGRWTALYEHLVKHMAPAKARRVASAWFKEVIGYASGSDRNRVASGKPPRGKVIGPG